MGVVAGTDADRANQLSGLKGPRISPEAAWQRQTANYFLNAAPPLEPKQKVFGVHGPVLTTLAAEPDWSIQRLFDWVKAAPSSWGRWHHNPPTTSLPANSSTSDTSVQPQLDGAFSLWRM